MSNTTTDPRLQEYFALVEFGDPGAVQKLVVNLLAELDALRARLHTAEQLADQLGRALRGDSRLTLAFADQALEKAEARAEQAEAALAQREQELADAAMEINCAGPVAHRIRIMRQEWSELLEAKNAELAALQTDLASLEQEMREMASKREWATRSCMTRWADALHAARTRSQGE